MHLESFILGLVLGLLVAVLVSIFSSRARTNEAAAQTEVLHLRSLVQGEVLALRSQFNTLFHRSVVAPAPASTTPPPAAPTPTS